MVRVTVASATRRVDLALPEAVPVAELVHELARSVGLLDPATAHCGYRLVTAGGRELTGETGLAGQGIQDGALLTVAPRLDEGLPQLYDDVADAMADVVERDFGPWDPDVGRRVAQTTAVLLAAIGALALMIDGSFAGAVAAAGLALALAAGASVISRVGRDSRSAVGATWMGATYAAIAGFGLAVHGPALAPPAAYAGAGAAIVGLGCLIGLVEGRSLVIPPIVVGAMFLAAASATRALPAELAVVLATVLTIVVLTGSFVPALALGATGVTADAFSSLRESPVDIEQVSADARLAQQIVLATSTSTGLLLFLVAPLAVSLGLAGTFLAVAGSLVVMLRTRRHHACSQVRVGLVSGLAGFISVAIAVLYFHPVWRPTLAVCLAMAAFTLLPSTLLPSTPSLRRDRLADLIESAALLATLPLLLVAVGAFAAIRH